MISLSLEEACELVTDGTHYTPTNAGVGVPFLTVKDMRNVGLDLVDSSKISEEEFLKAQSQNSAPVTGDVLFSKDGSVGKVHVVGDEGRFAVLSSIAILRPNPKLLDPNYLSHYLRTPKALAEAEQRKTGSALTRVILKDLKSLRVPLPRLAEQKRIAAILDAGNALRAKRRAALTKLDTLAQSIFLGIFGDPAFNKKGWQIRKFGDLMSEVYRYPTYFDIKYQEEGVPEVRGELLSSDGSISTDGSRLRYIAQSTSDRFPRTILSEGDLVASVRGTIGKFAIVPPQLAGANITANLIRLSPNPALLNSDFAYQLVQSAYFRSRLVGVSATTTIATIKASDLKDILVPAPPLRIQVQFNQQVAEVNRTRKGYRESLKACDALFASLQHRAFRGEL